MWEKKNLKRTLHYCQVFTFTIMCVLLNKLLMDLFSWKFVNVSIRVSDLGFVNVSVGGERPRSTYLHMRWARGPIRGYWAVKGQIKIVIRVRVSG